MGRHSPIADDRSATAKAMSKVSSILGTCFVMVMPAFVGSWIDKQLSTVLLFTIIGLVVGMTAAMLQLMRLANSDSDSGKPAEVRTDQDDQVTIDQARS